MARDEMRAWEPDPNATIFELIYEWVGLGWRKHLKCPVSARMAIRAFADDPKVQGLRVIALDKDGRPL